MILLAKIVRKGSKILPYENDILRVKKGGTHGCTLCPLDKHPQDFEAFYLIYNVLEMPQNDIKLLTKVALMDLKYDIKRRNKKT